MRVGEPTPGSIGYLAMKLWEAMNPEDDETDWEGLVQSERNHYVNLVTAARKILAGDPVPMLLVCPDPRCCMRHIDEGDFATKPHHTHACQSCGMVWRPALGPTVGVQFLPGFKNEP